MTSSYEQERLKKVERNRSRLAALGLDSVKIGKKEESESEVKQKKTKPKEKSAALSEKRTSERLKTKTPQVYNYDQLMRETIKLGIEAKKKNISNRRTRNEDEFVPYVRRRRGYTQWLAKQESVGSTINPFSGQRSSARLKKKRRRDYSQFDSTFNEFVTDMLTKSDIERPSIMFTQDVESSDDYNSYLDIVSNLGGSIEQEDITKVTHLISTEFKRTMKHLCAIGLCIKIMQPDWILASNYFGTWVEESQFLLETPSQIEIAIINAQTRKLFENHTFLITPNVSPEPSVLEKIIVSNGGTVIQDLNQEKDGTFHIISCTKDLDYLKQHVLNNAELMKTAIIHESEFVIQSAYTQKQENAHLLSYQSEEQNSSTNNNSKEILQQKNEQLIE